MPAEEINPLAPLDEYGIDSILIVQLTNERGISSLISAARCF
ncbi:acyl carrier protein [Bacillus velezensis]|nr:acyl carrier protein [Bacillus velezensis]